MKDFRPAGALSRRLFSWPGVAAFGVVLAAVLGLPWLIAQHYPAGFELPLGGLAVALMAAATWCMSAQRRRQLGISGGAPDL